MPVTKATKKFEKKYLGDVLKRRKGVKKIKQKEQQKARKKEKARKDAATAGDGDERDEGDATATALNSMSVDDFFAGGFEVPEDPKASKKRKRSTPQEKKKQESEDESEPDTSIAPGGDSDAVSDDEGESHKKILAGLAEKDPEFHNYLQNNDAELLDFDEDGDLAALDALSDSDEEETPKKKKKTKQDEQDGISEEEDSKEVKMDQVEKWTTAIKEKRSLKAAKELVTAFRAAVHVNEEDAEQFKYSISNPEVYHALLMSTLKNIPELINHLVPIKEKAGGKIQVPTDSGKFKTVSPLVKTFVASTQHLLENLSDSATIKTTMTCLLDIIPYTLQQKKLVKGLTKSVVDIWSDSSNTESSRITAFLVLRKLVVVGDAGIRETVLRATYQGLVKGSRNTTIHTIQGVNLMKNSAADLWGIDPSIGYTTGFTFIRQLAIHLRSSITQKSKDAYKTVYNWQYVHSLDFWSRVLAVFCNSLREAEAGKESPLRLLIYPVVQVTLGALRLIPTSQYFPLRFQLIRSLLRISLATGTYIPLAAPLYEVLTTAEMRKPPKSSTLKALDFSINIRAPAAYLKTRIYQDGVGEQVVELFSDFLVQWSKSVAFPELALPITVMLKRWLKDMNSKASGNKNSKVNSMVALLVQKLEANSKWVEEKRSKVEFAPENRAGVENFLKDTEWEKTPLGAFVVTQRRMREEKAKVLEQARREAEADRKKEKNAPPEAQMEVDGVEIEAESDEDDEEMDVDGVDEDEDDLE